VAEADAERREEDGAQELQAPAAARTHAHLLLLQPRDECRLLLSCLRLRSSRLRAAPGIRGFSVAACGRGEAGSACFSVPARDKRPAPYLLTQRVPARLHLSMFTKPPANRPVFMKTGKTVRTGSSASLKTGRLNLINSKFENSEIRTLDLFNDVDLASNSIHGRGLKISLP
jgi:hypothetical protein